jgi:hypothetical protein
MKPALKGQLDQSQLLDAVPTHNQAVRSERRANALLLWVPIRRRGWMLGPLRWLLPFRDEKGIALDAVGQEVWQACDGKRRLEEIIEQFAEHHQLRFHEARLSVLQFVRSLVQRNLVALVVPQATLSPREKGPSA